MKKVMNAKMCFIFRPDPVGLKYQDFERQKYVKIVKEHTL